MQNTKVYVEKTTTEIQSVIATPKKTANRSVNLDIVRIIAFLFVPLVHFFMHTGFYSNPVSDMNMYIGLVLRNIGHLCIPLFLLLTGYLQGNKKITPDIKYFAKIFKFVVPFLAIVLLGLLYRILVLGNNYDTYKIVKEFFNYPGYSWYVEMYIGLFLLIPFLNMIWNNLTSFRQEIILVSIMLFISVLPTIINAYDFGSDNPWSAASKDYLKIIPNYWTVLYPFAIYFTGAFLKKNKDKFKLQTLDYSLFLVIAVCLFSIYNISRNIGIKPTNFIWVGRGGFGQLVIACLILLLVESINMSRTPTGVSKFLGKISDLTFSAYLITYYVDKTLYPILNKQVIGYPQRLPFLPLMVLAVAVISLVLSFVIELITKPLISSLSSLTVKLFTGKKSSDSD